jgi:uroporphyrinogen decarboxylase
MTPRERMIAALEGQPLTGLVPHFELVFFLTMEAFGRVHPKQRHYRQWNQMSETERTLHRKDVADLHVATARRFDHSGFMFHGPSGWAEKDIQLSLDHVREISDMKYMTFMGGDATYSIPGGAKMMDFVVDLADDPEGMKDKAQRQVDKAIARAEKIKTWGTLDGFCLCSDYCYNDNPFLSPTMLDEFVMPYLTQLTKAYRDLGFYVIKHTDGNIMPILDSLIESAPHAIHSLDPQGGVDMTEVRRRVGGKIALVGNVNCGLLQNGSEQEVIADVRRALREGMSGGGYVFSTSNCIYTGMALERYELMLRVWREYGVYS